MKTKIRIYLHRFKQWFYGVHFKKTKNKIAETTIIGMTILFSYSEFRP
jgi:hypothetical protein